MGVFGEQDLDAHSFEVFLVLNWFDEGLSLYSSPTIPNPRKQILARDPFRKSGLIRIPTIVPEGSPLQFPPFDHKEHLSFAWTQIRLFRQKKSVRIKIMIDNSNIILEIIYPLDRKSGSLVYMFPPHRLRYPGESVRRDQWDWELHLQCM